ncbi:MAG: ABC transporter permease subunit [Treponema sp.]|nr:ABC transporter permease subunit [Treponema sp.]
MLSWIISFGFDTRKRLIAGQFIFALVVIYFFSLAAGNVMASLNRINMVPSFRFLRMESHIDIGEALIPMDNSSSNWRVFYAGFLNTISVSFLVIFFSTLLGLAVGLCRLSSNWLVEKSARLYIEIIRNIPLMLLLLIWYRAFFMRLPDIRNALMWEAGTPVPGERALHFSLSNRGLSMTWLRPSEHIAPWLYCLAAAAVFALGLWVFLLYREHKTGREQRRLLYPLLLFMALGLLSYAVLPHAPLQKDVPVMGRFNISGGLHVSAEWFSLFSGLILYTSAFIAEIFRAGIQGIPKGQIEAARSLGLRRREVIRLVVIPQAKVVIIPPLTSQYLGVAKNTSLGIAIGFPDLFSLSGTIINQTGRALEMILLAMGVYLALSLLTSLVMNIYNKQVQIRER